MGKTLKELLRDWLPPVVMRWVVRGRGMGSRFEGDYATWNEASSQCDGYDADKIFVKVLAATLKVKKGEAIYERDSVLFDHIEYSWPVLSGLMWSAARNCGRLNVLDFGGSLGSSYFQNRKFLQSLSHVGWNVIEQSHYVEAGQKYIQGQQLRFYKTIDECLKENRPNVILLSSVLQYIEDPVDLISKLTAIKATCLIIDKTPFSSASEDKLLIQRVSASIYPASYPMWVFSMQKFLELLKTDWYQIAPIMSPDDHVKSTSYFEFAFQGMLMELRS